MTTPADIEARSQEIFATVEHLLATSKIPRKHALAVVIDVGGGGLHVHLVDQREIRNTEGWINIVVLLQSGKSLHTEMKPVQAWVNRSDL